MDKKSTLRKATKSDFDWFKNDNYIFTKQFDALTWSNFIKDRLLKSFNVKGFAAFILDENDEHISAKSFCEEIQNGVVKIARTYSDLGVSDGEKTYGSTSFSPYWDESHVIRSVSPLTVGNLLRMDAVEDDVDDGTNYSFEDLPPGLQKWSTKTGLKISNEEGFYDVPYDLYVRRGIKLFERPSTNQGLINLQIDLNVTNEEIIEEMTKLLKVYRAAISKTECKKGYVTVKKSDVAKLHTYKVLPHYDLRLWAAYKGLALDDALIVELLFGNSIDPKEFEGKQKKLYTKVFDYSYADSLELYARSLDT